MQSSKIRPIKIFHLTDALPDYHSVWGGAEKVAYRQIRMSVKLESRQVFVGGLKPIKKIEEDFNFVRIWTTEDILPQKLQHYISGFKNQIIPFDIISFLHLIFIILKIKPNIIHLHKAAKISLTPIIIARLFKIPLILAIYDYWFFCPTRLLIDKEANPCYKFHGKWCKNCSALEGRSLLKLISVFRKKFFDLFLGKVNRFSVLSQACKDLVSKYPLAKEKIFVVRQLSIKPPDNKTIPVEPNSVFFNTWMLPHKGVHIVIKAITEVSRVVPQVKFYLAVKDADHYSEPNYFEKIKKMIEDLNIGKNLIFIKKPSHQKYLELIKKANVVVVAEQWENMAPTTLADAMSLGKAIVASKIGGIPEMVKDRESGLLADPREPQDFAEKIIRILSDFSFASRLGQRAALEIKKIGKEEDIRCQLLKLYL